MDLGAWLILLGLILGGLAVLAWRGNGRTRRDRRGGDGHVPADGGAGSESRPRAWFDTDGDGGGDGGGGGD